MTSEQSLAWQLIRAAMRLPDAQEFARQLGQQIARAGGEWRTDSKGRVIYPGRIEVGFSVTVFDPKLSRDVQAVVKMRATLRPLNVDRVAPAGVITGIEVAEGEGS